jgi:hypothetical protein
VCPGCQADARFVSRRERTVTCLLGEICVRRAYYHCRRCRSGLTPWDQVLGLSPRFLTPAVAELAALAGALCSFALAAERTLRKMAGLRISESTLERTTEEAGGRVGQLLAKRIKFGPDRVWDWRRDAAGRSCAYVSLDATGVRRQGKKGAAREGRMAYVAAIYNPDSEHDQRPKEPHPARYLAGFYELDELGIQLRRQAGQVGWDEAQQQIALSDGGSGLEPFLRSNFPRAEVILDFWHAKEHLVELGQALWEDQAQRQAWLDKVCRQLKHEGGAAVLAELEQTDPGKRPLVREAHRQTVQFFSNHQHKMDYPRYVARGWQIGSGPVESACRTVVGDRLKGGGMRWGDPGADALCHLRALFLSEPDQWDSFWRVHRN